MIVKKQKQTKLTDFDAGVNVGILSALNILREEGKRKLALEVVEALSTVEALKQSATTRADKSTVRWLSKASNV